VWFDEEPPVDIYSEGKARTNVGNGVEHGYPDFHGYVYTTFTPFKGISDVVGGFYPECNSKDKSFTMMGLYDVMRDTETGKRGHYSKERVEQLLAGYEIWERDARGFGIPVLGDGAVFSVDWDKVVCEAFPIPKHWLIINGIDFGWDHPSAGVQIAIDPDSGEKGFNGTIYVVDVFKKKAATAADFASSVRTWPGQWAWPHDGAQHEKSTGIVVSEEYRRQGLDMLHERATHDGKSNSLELSLNECKQRFLDGQLRIFNTAAMKGGLQDSLLTELRQYHRIDGKVVPIKDDAIAAMRYAIMMRRFAKAVNDKDDLAQLIRDRNKRKRAGGNYMAI
jgi:phage terminase large subunit-like protein